MFRLPDIHISIPMIWILIFICNLVFILAQHYLKHKKALLFTKTNVIRRFTLLELYFPEKYDSIVNIFKGINRLPVYPGADNRTIVKKTLIRVLLVDCILKSAVYLIMFLLCFATSYQLNYTGMQMLQLLAYLEILIWMMNMFQNMFLIYKFIRVFKYNKPIPSGRKMYLFLHYLEWCKWIGFGITAAITFGCLGYFWVSGKIKRMHFILLFLAILLALFNLLIYKMTFYLYKKAHKLILRRPVPDIKVKFYEDVIE